MLPSHWCLFLDVDGTLLEFAARPDDVRTDEPLRKLLARLESALQGAVALVSGRPIAQLDRLFAPKHWPAAGLHGLERRDASGRIHRKSDFDAAMPRLRRELTRIIDRVPGAFIEDKGPAIAVHYRAAPHAADGLRRATTTLVRRIDSRYTVLDGKMVLEIVPEGASKQLAIRAFLAEPPFAGRRPIFIGDDATDCGGLREVERHGGLSVVVGCDAPAMLTADGPGEVRRMLSRLAETGAPS